MNDQEKLRIRQRARRQFIRIAIGLVVIGGLLLWMGYLIRGTHQNEQYILLMQRSQQLLSEQTRRWAEKGKQLAAYFPPQNPSEQTAWAARIERHFGYPSAVFLKDGSKITWIMRPQAEDVAREAELLYAGEMPPNRHPLKAFGTREVWHTSFHLDEIWEEVWFVRDSAATSGWGVVSDFQQSWLAFFRELSAQHDTTSEFGSSLWMLSRTYSLPASAPLNYLITFRAFLNDSLILESPDIDTTRMSYTMDMKDGRKVIFYSPRLDLGNLTDRNLTSRAWFMALYPILLIIPFYRWYRTVRKLTEI